MKCLVLWGAVVSCLGTAACLEEIEPEVGPLLMNPCANEDSDPNSRVSFMMDIVPQILSEDGFDCVQCHTPEGTMPFGLETSGFDVSTFTTLRAGGRRSGENIVIAGTPCGSILWQKVRGTANFGARMPLDGPPFLSANDLQLLADWIAEGANEN